MKFLSSIFLVLLLAVTVFAAPADPTVTPWAFPACPDPSTRIMVLWTYLDSNGNYPAATTFDIDRCTGTGCTSWSNIATGVTTQGHLSTGLSANTIYRFRFRVVDGSGTSGYSPITADITTAASNDHLARYPTTVGPKTDGVERLFGSMTCAATTAETWDPFTWLTSTQDTQAAYWADRIPKHAPGTVTGTVSITSGTNVLTGTGTFFLQELNTDNSDPDIGADYHEIYVGATSLGTVASCSSNTSCLTDSNYGGSTVTNQAATTWAQGQNDQILNDHYYDLGWNLYINAFRQGSVADFEDARHVADAWFSGNMRQGRNIATATYGTPRGSSLGMLTLRALDGRPEIWESLVIWQANTGVPWINNYLAYGTAYSVRDQGYEFKYLNQLQQVLPDSFPTSDGTCLAVANCGGNNTDGATYRGIYKTVIDNGVAAFAGYQSDAGLWVTFGSGGGGSAGDTGGADGWGQTLLMPLTLDAFGDIARNTDHSSTTRNSARKQLLKGANYMGMIAYNRQRVNNDASYTWRANGYAHGGGTLLNPAEYRFGYNPTLAIGSRAIGGARQNGCIAPNVFAHAYALSGKAIYRDMGMEYLNALFAGVGENTGGTGDGQQAYADVTQGKLYSECYRASMRMLSANLESPSSLGTAPVADAGSDVVLTGGQNVVTLSATSGSCANAPCEPFWTMRIGPQTAAWDTVLPTIVDNDTHTPTIINAEPGVYTLTKIQVDALGMADDDTMTLTVGSGGFKPTVSCFYVPDGAYPIGKISGTTSLTISCFAAPAGASETFSWSWGTPIGPKNLSTATVTSPTASASVVTLPGDGDYLFPTTATGNTSGLSRTTYTPFTVHRSGNAVPTLAQNSVPVVNAGLDQVLASGVTRTYLYSVISDAKAWQTYVYSASPPTGWVINSDGNLNIRGPGTFSTNCNNSAVVTSGTTINPTIDVQGGATTCTVTYNDGLEDVVDTVTITAAGGTTIPVGIRGRITGSGRIVMRP